MSTCFLDQNVSRCKCISGDSGGWDWVGGGRGWGLGSGDISFSLKNFSRLMIFMIDS